MFVMNQKRKLSHTPNEELLAKRSVQQTSQHAQLAGQNSVLASMLKQTTMVPPSVSLSMACAMVSQLSEERLRNNLKIHTPYTGTSTSNKLNVSPKQNASMSSDPSLSFLLDDVCNMEEEYKITSQECLPDLAVSTKMASAEEAIEYIKRQLMSCESSVLTESPLINMIRQMDTITVPSVVLKQNLVVPNSFTQANQIPTSPPSTNSAERIQSSVLHSPVNNFNRIMSHSHMNNGQGSPQNINVSEPPQKKRQIIKGQQKRMRARQQQKRQIPQPIQVQSPFITKNGKIQYMDPNQQSRAFALSPDENKYLLDNTVASKIGYEPYPRNHQRPMDLRYDVQQSMNISAPPQKSPVQQSAYHPAYQQYHQNYHQARSITPQPCSQAFVQQMQQKEPQNTQSGHQQNHMLQDQFSGQQPHLANQQGHQMAVNYTPTPGLQNSLNSHFQPLSSGMTFYQQQQNMAMVKQAPLAQAPQQNMQRMVQQQNMAVVQQAPLAQAPQQNMQRMVQQQNMAVVQQPSLAQTPQQSMQRMVQQQNMAMVQQPPLTQAPQQNMQRMVQQQNMAMVQQPPLAQAPQQNMQRMVQQQNMAMVQQPPLTQAPQQNMQRMVSVPKQQNSTPSPAGFSASDPIYSPQSSQGSFTPPLSSCNISMPRSMSRSSNFSPENVFYNQQVYPGSMMDRNHCNDRYYVASPEPCQELPSVLGQRTQQHQSSLKLYESHPFQNQGYQKMSEQMAAF